MNSRTLNLKHTLLAKKPIEIDALDLSRDESDCLTQKYMDESVVCDDIQELVTDLQAKHQAEKAVLAFEI